MVKTRKSVPDVAARLRKADEKRLWIYGKAQSFMLEAALESEANMEVVLGPFSF